MNTCTHKPTLLVCPPYHCSPSLPPSSSSPLPPSPHPPLHSPYSSASSPLAPSFSSSFTPPFFVSCFRFLFFSPFSLPKYRLDGLVVKASFSRAEDPGSNPACAGIFPSRVIPVTKKIGTPVVTLPGAWHYRVIAGTGWPGVSIL